MATYYHNSVWQLIAGYENTMVLSSFQRNYGGKMFVRYMFVVVNHMQILSVPVLSVDDCVGSSLDEGGAARKIRNV